MAQVVAGPAATTAATCRQWEKQWGEAQPQLSMLKPCPMQTTAAAAAVLDPGAAEGQRTPRRR
jgi:hypothetical protein